MRATTLHLVMVGTAAVISSTAYAAAGKDTTAARAGTDKMRVGITLLPMPLGLLRSGGAGSDTSVGSVFAFAVMTSVDFVTHPNVFVGLAPSYAFHIKARGADVDPGQELDLLLRLGYTAPVGRWLHPYGYVALGYSFISGIPGRTDAQGLVIGLHGGALLDLTPSLFLDAELGYQAGFQRDLDSLMERNQRASFVQVGVGVGVRI
jgi:hypothetical protein